MRTKSLLFAVVILAAWGCDKGSPTEIDAAVGQYALSTIEGDPLPKQLSGSFIQNGGLNINADGTWAWWHNWANTPGGSSALAGVTGTWVRIGPTTLEFTATSAPFAGQKQELTVTGSSATRVNEWVYVR